MVFPIALFNGVGGDQWKFNNYRDKPSGYPPSPKKPDDSDETIIKIFIAIVIIALIFGSC